MPRTRLDLGQELEHLAILAPQGQADPALDPQLDDDVLLRMYRAMVLARKLDERMLIMQRQGEMGTFAPGTGQEAIQIGSIQPLRPDDWFWPSYRSFGSQLWRGWTIEGLLLLWDGYFQGFAVPEGVNEVPFSIVVGAHVLPAVGIGMGIRLKQLDQAVLTTFGDGATSQGDVSEAFNFAGVFQAPVIFLCENNQWAISTPYEKQTRSPTLAHRALGFGIRGVRVDGNDVLAVQVATREAVERARAGEGPTLIECLTYRMSLHTTADDPRVYRAEDEVEPWRSKDPIRRFERYLEGRGLLTDRDLEEIGADLEAEVNRGRERFDRLKQKKPREVFDFLYAELPPELAEQRADYLARLDREEAG